MHRSSHLPGVPAARPQIVPGFFLPKPADWINEGTRSISGAYEDELSSEPWAGVEPNALGEFYFALDFLDAGNAVLGSAVLDLIAAGLFDDNGLAFDYKLFGLSAVAPGGTATVRARISMLNATLNPQGGGQAFVVDDFELTAVDEVPEPGALALLGLGLAGLGLSPRRKA